MEEFVDKICCDEEVVDCVFTMVLGTLEVVERPYIGHEWIRFSSGV